MSPRIDLDAGLSLAVGRREAAAEAEGGLLERQDVTTAVGELVSRVAAGGAGAVFVAGEAAWARHL